MPSAVVEAPYDGSVVAAAATDDAGRYELTIDPGTYLIRATAGGMYAKTAEGRYSKQPGRTVTVSAGQTLIVGFLFDTLIRCRWGHVPAKCPLRSRCRWAAKGNTVARLPNP